MYIMTEIFEQASREQFRYTSVRGQLATEQLWQLPLTSKNGFSLDDVAKAVNQELRDVTTESFVATEANPAKAELETKLEILKHIIAVKISDAAEARNAAGRRAEKDRLLAILDRKQDQEFEGMTKDELLARIGSLG